MCDANVAKFKGERVGLLPDVTVFSIWCNDIIFCGPGPKPPPRAKVFPLYCSVSMPGQRCRQWPSIEPIFLFDVDCTNI